MKGWSVAEQVLATIIAAAVLAIAGWLWANTSQALHYLALPFQMLGQSSSLPGWALLLVGVAIGVGAFAFGVRRGATTMRPLAAAPAPAPAPAPMDKNQVKFESMDAAEKFVLRQMIDAGKQSMTVDEFILYSKRADPERNVSGDDIADAIERLRARGYCWMNESIRPHTMGMSDYNFALLSEHPSWIGSSAPPRMMA